MKAPQGQAPVEHSQQSVSFTEVGQLTTTGDSDCVKSSAQQQVRVLVVDDHPVVRKGVRSFLTGHKYLSVAGEAVDGREALTKAAEIAPDVILMNIDMPRLNGLTATKLLRRQNPNIKVVILSMHKPEPYGLEIVQSGALGFVSKEASPKVMIEAIETVATGGTFFDPELSLVTLKKLINHEESGQNLQRLSPREREVLVAIAQGASNKEIAYNLGLDVRTIETHRERIMRKLKVHNIAGLTRLALQQGLISL